MVYLLQEGHTYDQRLPQQEACRRSSSWPVKKLLGSPLRQGGSLEDSLQVTDTSFCNMVTQEPQPASVRASEYLSDLPRTAVENIS